MCWYLYAYINEEAYNDEFFMVCNKFQRSYKKIKEKDLLFIPDVGKGIFFRLTNHYCDCDTSLGGNDVNNKELTDYIDWLLELNKCKNMKYIGILKFWQGSHYKKPLIPTIIVNIRDIDAEYLANIKEDTFYKIQLFKIYN